MPGTMSVGGLASGLKTDEIIAKIMEYARRPQTKLQADVAQAKVRLATWQDLNTRVLAVKLQADSIADARDFEGMKVTSSDESVVTATAYGSAAPGSYYVKVVSRAQSHQVASASGSFTSVNDAVGTGDVTIALENGTTFSVTLTSNNNTLAALRDEINKANKGVKAAIVNQGSTDSPNYRLLLTTTKTGTANAIKSVDTSGLSGGTAPVFTAEEITNNPVQAATNAVVEMGAGGGKITVTSSSNTISDLIPGVTLNVLSADSTKTIRLDVARDTSSIQNAINTFVQQYNDLMDAVNAQFKYDAETGESGSLMGDFQLQSVQQQIQSAVSTVVSGLTTKFTALAQIGIVQDTGGHLAVNSTDLTKALEDNFDDVKRLFGPGLDSESAYLTFVGSSSETRPSGKAGWQVQITQAARRAQATAGTELSGTLDANEVLTINGKSISLTSGMSIDDVIAEINKRSSETNVTALKTGADGTGTGNYLTLRVNQYGSEPTFNVVSNRSAQTGVSTGFGNQLVTPNNPTGESGTGQGMVGLDVAGTINGATATGKGQILSLSVDSKNDARGISINCAATTAMGPVKIVYTKGVGSVFRDLLVEMTSPTGVFTTAQNGINDLISDLGKSIVDMESRLADQQERLYAQFNAMEAQLAKLQQQGNYLAAQLGALNKSK
jgi:flagellar hook-associated protein 2